MDRPVALITGGAKRVGRAVALHLAGRGFDVAFTYHSSSHEAEEVRAAIAAAGVRACAIRADLNEPAPSVKLISEVMEQFHGGHVKVLVNNASLYEPDSAGPEVAGRMWKINVQAPVALAHALAEPLKRSHGCVINLCDILADRPMKGWLAYCGTKAALASATIGLARELAPEVRCVGIAPGVVDWPGDYTEAQKLDYLSRVPLQRAGTPEDVAKLVAFLATEGTYLTGQVIRLDGGRSIAP